VDVYHEVVNLLLGFWKPQERDLSRARELELDDGTGVTYSEESLAVGKKKSRLAHLAWWMQEKRLTDAPADQARESLAAFIQERDRKDKDTAVVWAENFLRNSHERSGVFVEIEPDKYAFTHQGFREYLVATAIKDMRDDQFLQTILTHLTDDWWEQVVLLAGAYPNLPPYRRTDLIEKILESTKDPSLDLKNHHARLLMAGRCAIDMASDLPESHREKIQRALFHLMRDSGSADQPLLTSPAILSPKTRLEAGLLLDALDWTPNDLYDFVSIGGQKSNQKSEINNQKFIGKYPVTNLQYARFIESDDYVKQETWQSVAAFSAKEETYKPINLGDAAWEWFNENGSKSRRPVYWDDARFGSRYHLLPVVGLTWYEAAAYCVWLQNHFAELPEGKSLISNFKLQILNFKIRLPLEEEWVQAAGGEGDGYRLAWENGNEKDKRSDEQILMRANTNLSKLEGTSPVGMYLAGKTLSGAFDMSGNVWEWQSNRNEKSSEWLALRGGSWGNHLDDARVSARSDYLPYYDWYYFGFRVVALPS
jgi:formylglycine-generating enzyme required for sulfatase activity